LEAVENCVESIEPEVEEAKPSWVVKSLSDGCVFSLPRRGEVAYAIAHPNFIEVIEPLFSLIILSSIYFSSSSVFR
jgi:branched-subunit amino acid permease